MREAPVVAASRAKGSSFYAAMRILPRDQRQAMYAIYNICRAVDDIADEQCAPQQRLLELSNWRRDLDALYTGGPPGRFATVASTVRRFGLKQTDFVALLDGMTMDAERDMRAPDMAMLDLYCDRVASAVGRLSNQIFDIRGNDGLLLAHHLGRALQLTNILRDLDEDADLGRLYLPREALTEASIASCVPNEVISHPAIARACQPIVAQARWHFREANAAWRRIPRAKTRAPRLMGAVYARLLGQLEARGFQPPRNRVRLDRLTLISLLIRHGLF
ncbi:presqualene diphosphate synthase HpnD [Microvirga terricola]|uniref:Presqualene diphosphate synthase HpnD n=1 Tax=Microvirga terricola TaxID=2719797 RepID=A0ABX0VFF8_9HYPH|nr:presqualene diphosphate synthase HpnD [Microvirga terricola]NIX78236.1 presqualene diphosphate synthase HpnD [Microvirga terricola]